MKRYLLIFFLIFSDTIYAQKSLFKKHNLTLDVVNKIDFNQNFKHKLYNKIKIYNSIPVS